MGPHLIKEFGWSKADFAMVGALALGSVLVFPLVGRVTDLIGARRTAMIGIVSTPLIFLALSWVQDLRTYALLFGSQCVLLATTASPVYCRIVVQYVVRARGLALAIAASGPALMGAIGGPLLNNFVEEHGWRAGFIALAVFSAGAGLATLFLLPPDRKGAEPVRKKRKTAKEDYVVIFRTPAFWILFCGMLLCTLPQAVMLTQLNLVLAENGVMGKGASIMISAYATGMLVGRLLSGVALDRFPGPIVTTTGLALSAVGLLMIASGLDAPALLFIAVLLIGLAYGSESDAIAYLIVRNFGVRIYSSVFGLIAATVSISAALGAVLLSMMLKLTGAFAPFLFLTGILVLFGSMLFLLLPRNPDVQDSVTENEPAPAEEPAKLPRSAAPEGGPLEDQAEPLILR